MRLVVEERKKSRQWVCYKATLLSLGADLRVVSFLCLACSSVCNQDQNEMKQSRSILLASQEIEDTSELQKLPDQQTKEVWHPFFFQPLFIKCSRATEGYNQAIKCIFHWPKNWSRLPMLKGDIKVTTLWLYRDEICFMVISSLVCFTRWLTCRLMSLTSPWQFGQFCYTHVHPLEVGCLHEWQD